MWQYSIFVGIPKFNWCQLEGYNQVNRKWYNHKSNHIMKWVKSAIWLIYLWSVSFASSQIQPNSTWLHYFKYHSNQQPKWLNKIKKNTYWSEPRRVQFSSTSIAIEHFIYSFLLFNVFPQFISSSLSFFLFISFLFLFIIQRVLFIAFKDLITTAL